MRACVCCESDMCLVSLSGGVCDLTCKLDLDLKGKYTNVLRCYVYVIPKSEFNLSRDSEFPGALYRKPLIFFYTDLSRVLGSRGGVFWYVDVHPKILQKNLSHVFTVDHDTMP